MAPPQEAHTAYARRSLVFVPGVLFFLSAFIDVS